MVDRIYRIMTEQPAAAAGLVAAEVEPGLASPTDRPLPHASVGGLAGLLEILNSLGGRDDLPHLGRILTFEVDDLLPLLDAAEMLGFAKVADADIELTPEGKAFVEADILTSKKLFAAAAAARAPLVRAIVRALETTKDGTLNERLFLDLLRRGFGEEEGRAQLDTAIDWGRYAELFEYRSDDGELILTPAEDVAA
jgi:NitT/TauT family transport system ATP-binding protein